MNILHRPVRSALDDGIATVTFAFPGDPANAFTLPHLEQVVAACTDAAARPDVDIVVVTTDSPAGFAPGPDAATLDHLRCPVSRVAFSARGQRLLNQLAGLPAVTVAFITGPCRGSGLELALACDYRLAVARADSWVGFGPHLLPAWGGSARLRRPLPGVVTAREAVKLGAFHDAFCARRGRIELRQWLDRLQRHPVKPARREAWFGPTVAEKLAAERARFARVEPGAAAVPPLVKPLPAVVGAWGLSAESAAVVAELAARGHRAVVVPRGGEPGHLDAAFAAGRARGRWTPLEAEQARGRVTVTNDPAALAAAGWVVPADRAAARSLPVAPRAAADTLLGWYHALGLTPHAALDAPPRRRLAAA